MRSHAAVRGSDLSCIEMEADKNGQLIHFILHLLTSHQGHGRLSVVSVVCCQVDVPATIWPLVQRSPTVSGASSCVIWKPHECGAIPSQL